MGKTFTWIGCAGLLVLGCGDDAGMVPGDESSSGAPTDLTTGGPVDPTTSGPEDSGTTTTTTTTTTTMEPESTTEMAESSTGPVELCGNGVLDDGEVCDGGELAGQDCAGQGFDDGTLACADDCSDYDTSECLNYNCGDNITQGTEACDGTDLGGVTCESEGFDSGTATCALDCSEIDLSGCGTCGNVIVDGDEVCDAPVLFGQTCESQGFTHGELGCSADCLTYDFSLCIQCGNDIIDGVEPCDGIDLGGADCVSEGFVGGTLACSPDCELDITACNSCGNAIVDPGEGCDGMNLGGEDCASLGLVGGTLACGPSCQYDFSGCDIPGMLFGSDTGYNGYVIQGAPLPCDNILMTGTPTLLSDDSQIPVPIGFTFPLYGVNYTDVTIQSNGALHFGSNTYMTLTNSCLPTGTNPNTNNVYVFWDDLNPSSAGSEVYYQTLGAPGSQRFVVQWETAHFSGDTMDIIRVQAMLDEASGQISVCYPDTLSAGNAGDNGAEATSGIQQDPMNGFDYSCNTPDLTDGTLLFYIPV